MSLKRMAMKMAIAFAASKGIAAFSRSGGLKGLQQRMGGGQAASGQSGMGGGSGGGLGGILGQLGGGSSGGSGGGLSGILGQLGGMSGGGSQGSGGGLGGLLGGLAAMAGGGAALGQRQDEARMMEMAEAGAPDEATARAMIRAMAQAARADGHIDADEHDALMQAIGEANDDGDREAVQQALQEPVDPVSIARDTPAGQGESVYAAALTAIFPDEPAEKEFLRRLADALHLDADQVRQMHEMQGKPL